MAYRGEDHCFVICAYKENEFLEDTILSIKRQTVESEIYLSTSTPNDFIKNICNKYEIEMFINPSPKNAGADWNYGYNHAPTKLVTIAHQDDLYEPDFLEVTLEHINREKDLILAFTNYYELKMNSKVERNLLLTVKRVLNWPLSKKAFHMKKFVRRRCLSFGCAICCPSVTFNKTVAGESIFDESYINSCDYKTWTDLAELNGAFVYINKPLVAHRIYADSATTKNLANNIRQKEDLEILKRYWPSLMAKLINRIYATSEKNNQV